MQGTGGTVIHNLKDGVAATDAANVGQVNRAVSALAKSTDRQFKKARNQLQAASSIAAAMTGLTPNLKSKKPLQVQAALGVGSGAVGIAGGVSYAIDEDTLIVGKLGISTVTGVGVADQIGGAVGVSFGLDD